MAPWRLPARSIFTGRMWDECRLCNEQPCVLQSATPHHHANVTRRARRPMTAPDGIGTADYSAIHCALTRTQSRLLGFQHHTYTAPTRTQPQVPGFQLHTLRRPAASPGYWDFSSIHCADPPPYTSRSASNRGSRKGRQKHLWIDNRSRAYVIECIRVWAKMS